MVSELRKPLGQDRKESAGKSRRFSVAALAGAVALCAVLGLSVYTVIAPDNLAKPGRDPQSSPDVAEAEKTPSTQTTTEKETAGLPVSSGRSGANVRQETTEDGNVVSVFSPRPRDGDGPVLMTGQTYGQNPRMATMPNEDLLEDSAFGKLPKTGADGLRSLEQYARPWSGARGTRIAIVIGGLGLSQTGTQNAIRTLPPEITLAFAASGNSLQRWMQEARREGHEILLQVPFEPFGYPGNNPGPDTLLVGDSQKINMERLHRSMAKITNYTGVMNYLGGRYMADAKMLEPVLRDVSERGLLFLDDGSSAQSQTGAVAKALAMPHAFGDIQIDEQVNRSSIMTRLDDLERLARRNGSAIGVASAFDESITAVSDWVSEATSRGIEIVAVSALVSDRPGQ
ncbi:divergent polysaccharide deacetylase family protein [Agrobacterium sp. AGB01]|uniref:divergent polysaccharide deacetylase family protein n=1 Tax=Agrobacterium sp. AGB01 TaxID=2769302 RepID=UPI00177CC5D7|nr:divergent polysaccharide deacetylase family protein [Agrobacterium sp. AGB01]MBD9389533.1 divergent polysaccharide deacetylase family protein [Agrobacterium sp. AGB01]